MNEWMDAAYVEIPSPDFFPGISKLGETTIKVLLLFPLRVKPRTEVKYCG